ncbi:hypothetical protein H4S06_001412 [Coemansia sp. BCRC 34490]|nr:hypothetical protein H4S06_001412 [Coemansia sp. BCRC 34490]
MRTSSTDDAKASAQNSTQSPAAVADEEASAAPLLPPPPSYDDVVINIDNGGDAAGTGGSSSNGRAVAVSGHGRDPGVGPFGDAKPMVPPAPAHTAAASVGRSEEEAHPLLLMPSELNQIQEQQQQQQSLQQQPGASAADTLSSRDFFASLEYTRSAKGYTSSDAWLNTDVRALKRFISECNERPRVSVEVVGSHTEARTEHTTTRTNDGQTRQETTTRHDTVVDFKFAVELTPYIHGRGTLYTAHSPGTGEPYDLDRLLADYVGASNMLKEIKVQKKAIWDYELVRTEIKRLVKSTGYPHNVAVSFPMENDATVVRSSHTLGRAWRHPVTSFLCFITCACLVGWPLQYAATRRWRNKIMSDFVVLSSPKDYVDRHADFIRNQVTW